MQIEQLSPFKLRSTERRLSDELRDNIKKMYDIKEDIVRGSLSKVTGNMSNDSGKEQKISVKNSHQTLNRVSTTDSELHSSRSKKENILASSQTLANSESLFAKE